MLYFNFNCFQYLIWFSYNILILRSGKTEALSDSLQLAEKRVEFIKNVCQNTTKKLLATLTTHGLGHDAAAYDKRMVSKIFKKMIVN